MDTFDTEAAFSAATISSTVQIVKVAGYYEAGDGGGHAKVRIAAPSLVRAWQKQSSDGSWWEIAETEIDIRAFGAKSYTAEELIALNGSPSVDAQAQINDDALAAADEYLTSKGGGRLLLPQGVIVKRRRYERGDAIYVIGQGVGEWEPIYPARPKTWSGTTLLYKGSGVRDVTFEGFTSMENSGGWRENPDQPGSHMKIWSAYNSDATGIQPATKKAFSAAVLVKEGVKYGGLQHLRLCNWIGADGISGWSNRSTSSLGDSWDFGYAIRNGEYTDDYNIQVVGGWREAAHLNCVTATSESAGERNRMVRAKLNGRRGLIVRGPDIWRVRAATTTSVTIHWSSEIYFNPSGGSFRGSDNAVYSYTGVSHTGNEADYTFTGVTPDPSSIFEIRHASTGFGNTEYQDLYCHGLDHVSGATAQSLGFLDSKAFEISGFPCRGLKFRNSKFHTREPVVMHSHINQDLIMIDPQFEGGGYILATPSVNEQTYTPQPVRETRGLIIIASNGLSDAADLRLFTPRSAFVEELQLAPRSDLSGDLTVKPLRPGKVVDVYGPDIQSFFRMQEIRTTTSGMAFVSVTDQLASWKYIKIGNTVLFTLALTWSGLDTNDTSGISIRLPVNAAANTVFDGSIIERLSTGINLIGVEHPHLDLATDNYMGISVSGGIRLRYNSGPIQPAGTLYISGKYWVD